MTILAALGFGTPELILLLALPLSLACFGFWLWMLIDCVTKEEEQKIVWVILIAVIGIVGAPLYFFLRKLPRKNKASPNISHLR